MECGDEIALVERMGIAGPAIVVNQVARPTIELHAKTFDDIYVIEQAGRGLSRSRNQAIEAASADICLIADDDEILHSCYEERLVEAFASNPELDVIVFVVNWHDRLRKKALPAGELRPRQLMRVSSVQIAFRLDRVRNSGVKFDTRFGAGATFSMGEELIFLMDLQRHGLRIGHVPLEIAHLNDTESSWFTGYSEKYFRDRGASFSRASRRWGWLYSLQWAVRKRTLYSPSITSTRACVATLNGVTRWTSLDPDR